jgi:hypothetical protein
MSAPIPPRPDHDPLVCGILEHNCCPGCRWESSHRQPTPDDVFWQMRLDLGLARGPRILESRERVEILERLLNVRLTAQKHPAWGRALVKIANLLLKDTDPKC